MLVIIPNRYWNVAGLTPFSRRTRRGCFTSKTIWQSVL